MLRLDKFTLKSQEAIQAALQLAQEWNHQQIDAVHVSLALLKDKEGLIPPILEKLGISAFRLEQSLEQELRKLPQVEGQAPFFSSRLHNILAQSQKIAGGMKDEYV